MNIPVDSLLAHPVPKSAEHLEPTLAARQWSKREQRRHHHQENHRCYQAVSQSQAHAAPWSCERLGRPYALFLCRDDNDALPRIDAHRGLERRYQRKCACFWLVRGRSDQLVGAPLSPFTREKQNRHGRKGLWSGKLFTLALVHQRI